MLGPSADPHLACEEENRTAIVKGQCTSLAEAQTAVSQQGPVATKTKAALPDPTVPVIIKNSILSNNHSDGGAPS